MVLVRVHRPRHEWLSHRRLVPDLVQLRRRLRRSLQPLGLALGLGLNQLQHLLPL